MDSQGQAIAFTSDATVETETAKGRHAMASELLRASNGDVDRAIDAMAAWFLANLNDHLEYLTNRCAHVVVWEAVRNQRSATVNATPQPSEEKRQALLSAARWRTNNWLDAYLTSTGKKLGDCTREDLLEEIEKYHARAADNMRRAKWLGLIADKVGKKRVRDKFSDAQIGELKAEAEKD